MGESYDEVEDIKRSLQDYADLVSWLVTASEDEKHAVSVVEETIGSKVIDVVAERLWARLRSEQP